MVQILKELRIDNKIIDFIVRIYREDSTKIQLEKNKEIEIEVTSGIRQGCTASTVLFNPLTPRRTLVAPFTKISILF